MSKGSKSGQSRNDQRSISMNPNNEEEAPQRNRNQSHRTAHQKGQNNPTPYVFGLAEPSLSELLSGDVRVPSPHVNYSHPFVDGLGDYLPLPQPPK